MRSSNTLKRLIKIKNGDILRIEKYFLPLAKKNCKTETKQ